MVPDCPNFLLPQIEDLLEWLLQRGRELNATAQLGPQGLGATAGAVSRLQQAQRQQQQQQQLAAAQQQAALRQQQQQQQEEEAAARKLRQQQAAEVERDQLMRELVDAAVSQKHRLSPQVRAAAAISAQGSCLWCVGDVLAVCSISCLLARF